MSRIIAIAVSAVLFFVSSLSFAQTSPRISLIGDHHLSKFDGEDLECMLRDMLEWTVRYSRYKLTHESLVIAFVSPEVLSDGEACSANCPLASFSWASGQLQVSTKLDVLHLPHDKSVLLHELVHYFQWINGKSFRDDPWGCGEDLALEKEAYDLQYAYYITHGGRYIPPMIPSLYCSVNGQLKASLRN